MVRHRKAVCSTCRRRKSKCNGGTPRCSACAASSSTCHYEKAPSIAYVRSLQFRILELETKLKDSEVIPSPPSSLVETSTFINQDDNSISLNARGAAATQPSTSAAVKKMTSDARHYLVANAAAQKDLELLALNITSPRADVPPEICNILLKLHWYWILYIYSCCFIYNPESFNYLILEAKALLVMEILNQPLVPIVQALLQQKRLFWSLYSWDKHISLHLGRMPNFLMGSESVSLEFLDDFTEQDPWEPFYGPDPASNELPPYPAVPGHLCTLISQMMLKLYSPSSVSDSQSSPSARAAEFVELDRKLQQWYRSLPSFLHISPDKIPELSPPPHITSLDLIPLVASGQALCSDASRKGWETCRSATTAIYHPLQMYIKTYCTYTTATTAVYQLETSDAGPRLDHANEAVWTELRFLLDILQRTSSAMPGLNRSIDIIRTRIKGILDRQTATQLDSLFPAKTQSVRHMSRQAAPFPGGEDALIGDPNGLDVWLPAFPGQDVSYGAEVMLDMRDVVTLETRSALMGSNWTRICS
ncbi:hypothetical protein BDW62DRAFT_216787 [Aspergillus aurantiobrunneus]